MISIAILMALFGRAAGGPSTPTYALRVRPAGQAIAMGATELSAIVRQGIRWLYASEQDTDLIVRHLHAAYAVAYFDIALRATIHAGIFWVDGVHVESMLRRAEVVLDTAQRQLVLLLHGRLPYGVKP